MFFNKKKLMMTNLFKLHEEFLSQIEILLLKIVKIPGFFQNFSNSRFPGKVADFMI